MKISIITVTYNSGETLQDTIDSVISQTYKNIEYIIIDGKSKDNTLQIIQKNRNHIDKFISEKDSGLYDAMNKGIELATGDVVGFINSDDLFCNNQAIEKIVNTLKLNKQLDAVFANLYYVKQHNTNHIVRKWSTGKQKKFSKGWHPAHPTLYIKKEIYKLYGFFDLNYSLAADFEIMLRFFEKHKIKAKYIDEVIVKMRLGGETNKSIRNIIKQNIECIKAFRKNKVSFNAFIYPFFRLLPKLNQFKK